MVGMDITQDKACRKRKPKSAGTRPKCSKPGPITNNGYLNFIRHFRKKNCGLLPRELVSKAAQAWNCLPEKKKDFYRRQACHVTNSCKQKARPVCKRATKKKRKC